MTESVPICRQTAINISPFPNLAHLWYVKGGKEAAQMTYTNRSAAPPPAASTRCLSGRAEMGRNFCDGYSYQPKKPRSCRAKGMYVCSYNCIPLQAEYYKIPVQAAVYTPGGKRIYGELIAACSSRGAHVFTTPWQGHRHVLQKLRIRIQNTNIL